MESPSDQPKRPDPGFEGQTSGKRSRKDLKMPGEPASETAKETSMPPPTDRQKRFIHHAKHRQPPTLESLVERLDKHINNKGRAPWPDYATLVSVRESITQARLIGKNEDRVRSGRVFKTVSSPKVVKKVPLEPQRKRGSPAKTTEEILEQLRQLEATEIDVPTRRLAASKAAEEERANADAAKKAAEEEQKRVKAREAQKAAEQEQARVAEAQKARADAEAAEAVLKKQQEKAAEEERVKAQEAQKAAEKTRENADAAQTAEKAGQDKAAAARDLEKARADSRAAYVAFKRERAQAATAQAAEDKAAGRTSSWNFFSRWFGGKDSKPAPEQPMPSMQEAMRTAAEEAEEQAQEQKAAYEARMAKEARARAGKDPCQAGAEDIRARAKREQAAFEARQAEDARIWAERENDDIQARLQKERLEALRSGAERKAREAEAQTGFPPRPPGWRPKEFPRARGPKQAPPPPVFPTFREALAEGERKRREAAAKAQKADQKQKERIAQAEANARLAAQAEIARRARAADTRKTDAIAVWLNSFEALKDPAKLTSFPAPPSAPCHVASCQATASSRALKACECNIKRCLLRLDLAGLKNARLTFHPDKFSACPEKVRDSFQAMAREVFIVADTMFKEAKGRK